MDNSLISAHFKLFGFKIYFVAHFLWVAGFLCFLKLLIGDRTIEERERSKEMKYWITHTGLPVVAIIGGFLGIIVTMWYNFAVLHNVTLGKLGIASLGYCVLCVVFGFVALEEWHT